LINLLSQIRPECQSASLPYPGRGWGDAALVVTPADHKTTRWSWWAKMCCHLTESG